MTSDAGEKTTAAGAESASARTQPTLKRVLGDPLVHFLVVGIIVVGGYKIFGPEPPPVEDANSRRIEITQDDLRQLAVTWLAQGRPAPTPEQLRSLVEQKVTSEILFREAIALGLDRDDEIIKRRLAQKMDFLVADVSAMAPPGPGELETWYEKNSAQFAHPPRISFRHLYFSTDIRGAGARNAAAESLIRIAGRPPDSPEVTAVADPFMFQSYYGGTTPAQMAKEFGPAFSDALFRLERGSWQGPIESGYGWHLIWIDSLERGRIPNYDEVEPDVRKAWQHERYREVKERAIAEMRSRYTISVPPLDNLQIDELAISPRIPPKGPGS